MLQNEYLVAKICVDTAENEPRKESCGRGDGSRGRGPRPQLRAVPAGPRRRGRALSAPGASLRARRGPRFRRGHRESAGDTDETVRSRLNRRRS